MLREDKEQLFLLAKKYELEDILKFLSNFALDKSDDACDLHLTSSAKMWTSCSIILENALEEIRKIRK